MRYVVFCILFFAGVRTNAQLSSYRYWYDNDIANATTVSSSNQTISFTAANSSLSKGLHSLNFQSQDASGNWSSVIVANFSQSVNGNLLNTYRYWYDNDINDAIIVSSSDTIINFIPNTANLSKGYHTLNFQSKDSSGNWSSVISQNFNFTVNGQNKITYYRYWFDNNSSNATIISSAADNSGQFVQLIDIESLSTGLHNLNYQYGDAAGNWSSVYTLSFSRGVISSKLFLEPKVYVQKSTLNVGDVQTITGTNFTSNGQITLYVQTSTGDFIPTNSSFTYLPGGGFSYQLPITSSMPGGEYQVYATDVNTGATSPVIKFVVSNPITQKLWITEPSSNGNYSVNTSVNINWSDFVTATNAMGRTGYVQKNYKIEYSNDNGSTWQIIAGSIAENAQSNQADAFSTKYSFSVAGNYLIRVTDVDNLNDYNIASFNVSGSSVNSFTTSLQWDHSIPLRKDNPVGLAADGTARIFIKLNRVAGNKPVKDISAIIQPANINDNSSGTALLGKIMYATDTTSYSLQGNAANDITADQSFSTPSSSGAFAFWLVAPDDFTQQENNQDAERTIKVNFTITYSDNSTEVVTADGIRIVRPPLMMVHGINSGPSTWDNTQYNVDGTIKYFRWSGGPTGLFKVFFTPTLFPYGSYETNAQVLLSGGNNSFQHAINEMNLQRFADNRMDYVGHSMGGDVARTIININGDQYAPSLQQANLFAYKNYGRGYINKLITLNTPHNGSPLADFFEDLFNGNSIALPSFIANGLNGFFVKSSSGIIFDNYKLSPAVYDLQATHNGIRFNTTIVKNHLLGGDIDKYNVPDASLLVALNGTPQIKDLLDLAYRYLPASTIEADGIIDVFNAYISLRYGYPNFLSNSDGVVPIISQFTLSSLNDENNIPDVDNTDNANSSTTVGYGISRNHVSITHDLAIGTEIMRLLNDPINSGNYFANNIPANTNGNGTIYMPARIKGNTASADSIINYVDTNYIQILSPSHFSNVFVDSTININLLIKDTANLQKAQLIFQGEYYESYSKIANQTFNVKVHSDAIGYNQIVAQGLYDSSGFTIYHTDTATLIVRSLDTLTGFYLTPKSQNLNPKQTFEPVYNAVYTNYVGVLNDNIDSLKFTIADTNVVQYIDSLKEFTTKDTGTTYIVYNYKGFIDTGFIYVTLPQENPDITFSGKVYLQGAFNTSTGTMNNTLNNLGILQANASSQPYNNSTFIYTGNENVAPDFFASHSDIVDWVLLELRDSASPSTIISSRAAFVKQDGSLVDTDGVSGITFKNVPLGHYFVAVHHRNHLGIRSSATIDFTTGSGSYDFTTSAGVCYQNQSYTSTVQIGSIWAMRAGNANSNNNVKYNGPGNDENQILNIKLSGSLSNVLNNVYSPEDVNMNGNIKWNGPGNDQNFLLNTILNGSLSAVYLEQL